MGIFNKIGNWLIGVTEAKGDEPKSQKKESYERLPDAVDIRNRLKKEILGIADSVYLANPAACSGKNVRIYVPDAMSREMLIGFEQDLLYYLSVERGYAFASVVFLDSEPLNIQDFRKVILGKTSVVVYVTVSDTKSYIIANKAQISIYEGMGKLMQDVYELSNVDLQNRGARFYNIGRGACVPVSTGGLRKNDIIIDDGDEFRDNNQYVSRAHARIGYAEGLGFYLQVEQGGRRLSGNRTRIFRGQSKIEMNNLEVLEKLQTGDIIELGKHVLLEYKELSK